LIHDCDWIIVILELRRDAFQSQSEGHLLGSFERLRNPTQVVITRSKRDFLIQKWEHSYLAILIQERFISQEIINYGWTIAMPAKINVNNKTWRVRVPGITAFSFDPRIAPGNEPRSIINTRDRSTVPKFMWANATTVVRTTP
jgi:hypothetical protein